MTAATDILRPRNEPLSARLENNWPRSGMRHDGSWGGRCVGHFVAQQGRWSFRNPATDRIECGTGDPLAVLHGRFAELSRRGAAGIMYGYIAYEAGYEWLSLPRPQPAAGDWLQVPDIQFLIFSDSDPLPAGRPGRTSMIHPAAQRLVNPLTDRATYCRHVAEILELIAAGDIYQANYTQGFDLHTGSTPPENFASIRRHAPAPFNALLEFPGLAIIAASPERFWKKTGCLIETRPIKGTTARRYDSRLDRQARRALLASAKDRAELLMITDLERNDLGRIAAIGSVRTEMLARVRGTPSVWHLESTVTAQLPPETTWVDVMKAVFPGGSITGAPKRRAVEILGERELIARGVYCGAYGWVDARGDADFALAIRTAAQVGDRIRLYGGGGIVADSDIDAEHQESLIKIAPLVAALAPRRITQSSDIEVAGHGGTRAR